MSDDGLDPTTDAPPSLWPQPAPQASGGLLAIPADPMSAPNLANPMQGAPADPSAPNPDPMVNAHQSFLHRLSQGFLHAVSHVGATIGGNLVPNSNLTNPDGTPYYSDADMRQARRQALIGLGMGMASARPGFSTLPGAFAQGVGESQQAGQQTLTGIQNQRQQSIQMAQYQKLLASRQAIAQQYAVDPQDTNEQILHKLEASAAAATQAGDFEGAKAYTAAADSVRQKSVILGPQDEERNAETGQLLGKNNARSVAMAGLSNTEAHQQDELLAGLMKDAQSSAADFRKQSEAYQTLQAALKNKNPHLIAMSMAKMVQPSRLNMVAADELQGMGPWGERLANWLNGKVEGQDIPATIAEMKEAGDQIWANAQADRRTHLSDLYSQGTGALRLPSARVRAALTDTQAGSGQPIGNTMPGQQGAVAPRNPFPQ